MIRRRREDLHADVRSLPAALATASAVLLGAGAVALLDPEPIVVAGVAGAVALVAASLAIRFVVVRRFAARERAAQRRLVAARTDASDERNERAALRELDRGLDQATTEHTALETIRDTFDRRLADQPVELHLVDPVDPILVLTVSTGNHDARPGHRVSPWDSLAVRTGRTLLYETTERADVCSHLRSRLHEPASAVAVPVSVAGRALGVLYGFGPENDQPGPGDVEFLEDIAHVIATRIAILRSGAVPAPDETVDRLTGLPDRRTMQKRLVELLHDRVPFAVAVADIDGFGAMNDQRGRDAGDVALQLLGQVARRSLRPDDLLGRIGGDEFLIVFPNSSGDEATRAVERIREELVLGQSTAQCPQFTLSIGVIDSTCGSTIEELLHRAASALEYARNEGGNRVVVGHAAPHTPSG